MFEIKTKNVWYWLNPVYISPYALSMENWDLFHSVVKKKYPIQYFFRETMILRFSQLKQRFSFFCTKINYFFRHPRTEMRAAVFPARWEDLDTMLENFSREMVKEFVEREAALIHIMDKDPFKKQLKKHYDYITEGRPKLIAEIGVAADSNFSKYIKLRHKLINADENLLLWTVKNRGRFWM